MGDFYIEQGKKIIENLQKGIEILDEDLKVKIDNIKNELIKTNDSTAQTHIDNCVLMSNNIQQDFIIKITDEVFIVEENAKKWQEGYDKLKELEGDHGFEWARNKGFNNYTKIKTIKDSKTGEDINITIYIWDTYDNITINGNGYVEFSCIQYSSEEKNGKNKEVVKTDDITITHPEQFEKYLFGKYSYSSPSSASASGSSPTAGAASGDSGSSSGASGTEEKPTNPQTEEQTKPISDDEYYDRLVSLKNGETLVVYKNGKKYTVSRDPITNLFMIHDEQGKFVGSYGVDLMDDYDINPQNTQYFTPTINKSTDNTTVTIMGQTVPITTSEDIMHQSTNGKCIVVEGKKYIVTHIENEKIYLRQVHTPFLFDQVNGFYGDEFEYIPGKTDLENQNKGVEWSTS